MEEEDRFHPTRRWRADFAHLESRTLIEIEGGKRGVKPTAHGEVHELPE